MKTLALSILLSLVFLASGAAKLAGLAFEIAAFERWGYPLWFMYAIGVVEVAGGVGLLLRRWSALAGLGLATMMIGAVATHVIHAEWGMLIAATTLFGLSLLRAWLGRRDIVGLMNHQPQATPAH